MSNRTTPLPPGVRLKPLADGRPSYQVTVCIRRNGTGKQERRYQTFTPPPEMGKRDIVRELERIRERLLDAPINTNTLASGQTLRDFSEIFLSDKEFAGCTPKSLDNYRHLLQRILAELGNIPLNRITPDMIQQFYIKLSQTKSCQKHNVAVARPALKHLKASRKLKGAVLSSQTGLSTAVVNMALRGEAVSRRTAERIADALGKPTKSLFLLQQQEDVLTPSTVHSYHRCLRSLLNTAYKKRLISENPCDFVTLPKLVKKEQITIQPEELGRFFAELDTEPLVWQAIIHVYLVTGARRGEILGLHWDDIDFDTGMVTLDHALQHQTGVGLYTAQTKTNQTRYNYLPPQTLEILHRWKKEQSKQALVLGSRWERTGYIFTGLYGQPLRPDSVSQHVRKLGQRCEIDGLHTHTFRHTAASLLIGEGTDLTTVAGQLGHADSATTAKIYAHVLERNRAKAGKLLGSVIYDAGKAIQG